MKTTRLTIAVLLWLSMSGEGALAATCTSAATGTWTAIAWTGCAGGPAANDVVVIRAGDTVTLNTNSASLSSLTVNGTLTFGNNNTVRTLTVAGDISVASTGIVDVSNNTVTHSLVVSGNISNSGTFDLRLDGNSLCNTTFNAATTQTVSGNGALTEFNNVTANNNLTINMTGVAVTQTGTLSVAGNLTVQAGTLNLANTITVTGTTSISGTLAHTTTTGTRTFIGAVTIDNGGTWSNTANEAVTFRGGLTHNGTTFTAGTGVQTFSTNNQAIGGTSAITIPSITVTVVTLTNNGNLTATTALAGTGGLTNSATGQLHINFTGAVGITTLTASASGNLVEYGFAGAQTIKVPAANTYHHLTLSGSGIKTLLVGPYTIAGNFTLNSGVTYAGNTNNPAVNLGGDFSNSGTFTSGSGLFTFNGSVAQTLTGATTFTNLRVNNSSTGLTINNNVTVGTLLTLTAGVITTGTNKLITSASCATSVSRPVGGGHIAGNLQKRIPAGAPTCTFEIGDATTYRPVTLTFASVTTAGDVTGSVTQAAGDHPDTTSNTSGIDATRSVNRYWTFANSGVVFTTFNATFNYMAGDLDGPPTDAANFVVARGGTCSGSGAGRTCTTWVTTTPPAPPTTTQATANGFAAFEDFAIGEPKDANFSREREFIYTREIYQ